jgi:hypothetical protein
MVLGSKKREVVFYVHFLRAVITWHNKKGAIDLFEGFNFCNRIQTDEYEVSAVYVLISKFKFSSAYCIRSRNLRPRVFCAP